MRLSNFDRENERAEKQLENVPDADRREALARRQEARVGLTKQLERVRAALAEQQALAAARGQQQDTDTRKLQLEVESRKAQVAELEARHKALEDNLQSMRSRYNATHPQVAQLQAELERLSAQLVSAREGARQSSAGGRRIIDTSFSMDVGETVVVGTSRLGGGDRAIIALLTAVARAR
jgi:chromosome segregation ATPase